MNNEISKQIKSGSFKCQNLQHVVTDPNFQQAHNKTRQILPANQLMKMLMDKRETSKISSRDKEVLSIGSAGVELISNSYEFDES